LSSHPGWYRRWSQSRRCIPQQLSRSRRRTGQRLIRIVRQGPFQKVLAIHVQWLLPVLFQHNVPPGPGGGALDQRPQVCPIETPHDRFGRVCSSTTWKAFDCALVSLSTACCQHAQRVVGTVRWWPRFRIRTSVGSESNVYQFERRPRVHSRSATRSETSQRKKDWLVFTLQYAEQLSALFSRWNAAIVVFKSVLAAKLDRRPVPLPMGMSPPWTHIPGTICGARGNLDTSIASHCRPCTVGQNSRPYEVVRRATTGKGAVCRVESAAT
jgi:hypothetical protein